MSSYRCSTCSVGKSEYRRSSCSYIHRSVCEYSGQRLVKGIVCSHAIEKGNEHLGDTQRYKAVTCKNGSQNTIRTNYGIQWPIPQRSYSCMRFKICGTTTISPRIKTPTDSRYHVVMTQRSTRISSLVLYIVINALNRNHHTRVNSKIQK